MPSSARRTLSVSVLASAALMCCLRHRLSALAAVVSRPWTWLCKASRDWLMALSSSGSLIARSACTFGVWPNTSSAPISAGLAKVCGPLPLRLAKAGMLNNSAGMRRPLKSTLSCTTGKGRMRLCLPMRSSATPRRQAES
ncbi:hypothetical protein D3C84_739190 [compost metagenome]